MRSLGIILLLVGIIWGGVAFNLPTTIKTPNQSVGVGELQIPIPSMEVYNLDLADRRKTQLLISGVVTILGAILLGFSSVGSRSSPSGGLKKCPFCAEFVKSEALFCKHCGKELPPAKADLGNGRSLIQAAMTGDFETVFDLLRDGVDINLRDEAGKTAIDLAREFGHERIVDLLLSNGAAFSENLPPSKPMAGFKYEALETHLRSLASTNTEITLSFDEIETIIGNPLPASASNYREWWANQTDTSNRPQAKSWVSAGFYVDEVHQGSADAWVRFKRLGV